MPDSRCVVFSDSRFPGHVPLAHVAACLPEGYAVATAETLGAHLADCETLISFTGPYFPKAAWRDLLTFLERGGNIAWFGGMPFSRPVSPTGRIEPEQDGYTRALGLGLFSEIEPAEGPVAFVPGMHCPPDVTFAVNAEAPGTFWACSPCLSESSDYPDELGSAGPLDTLLLPLLHAHDGRPTPGAGGFATPFFLLDHQRGRFRRGRWLLSLWAPGTEDADWRRNAEALRPLLRLTAQGVQALDVRPVLACVQPGSAAEVTVSAELTSAFRGALTVTHAAREEVVYRRDIWLAAASQPTEEHCTLPPFEEAGLYRIALEGTFDDGLPWRADNGFWLWDDALVAATEGRRLSAGDELLYEGDRPFFVCGTTYMDSVVQRHYLLRPNPARWDRDLAALRAAGVNLIRTGIWTGWRQVQPTPGVFDEAMLHALDAFVLTACAHGLQVIFTFFAFSPQAPEGAHPWLDESALAMQEAFVGLLARRYAHVETLSWDLINEPSMGDPQHIFAQRPLPMPGPSEAGAFRAWLRQRTTLDDLTLRWRTTPDRLPDWEHVLPPTPDDYSTSPRDPEYHEMLRVGDFTAWAQAAFAEWAARMRRVIRAAGSRTLVGVGQDEAGSRPAPQFYAPSVDYTTTHPWWNLDALLWDLVMDKAPTTPNLAQETGVMLTRTPDMRQWRTERASAHLLERKLLLTLAARGAGAIQWLWHTNPYMTSDNENNIGLVRADGSAKPELATMHEFIRLAQALGPRIVETPPAPVWVVIPYSQWFVRPELGIEATQRAVRALGYGLGIVPQMVGEHALAALLAAQPRPQLVIVPGVQVLDESAWSLLRQYVREGGTLLVNGIATRDAHDLPMAPPWRLPDGPEGRDANAAPQPVSRHETLLSGQADAPFPLTLTFDGEKIGYVRKAHNALFTLAEGAGRVLWCGLPAELSSSPEALVALYAHALGQGAPAVENAPDSVLVVRRPLTEGTLTVLVSESGAGQRLTLKGGTTIWLDAERAGAVIETAEGVHVFGGCTLGQ